MHAMARVGSDVLLALINQKSFSWSKTVAQLEQGDSLLSILEMSLEGLEPTFDSRTFVDQSIVEANAQIENWRTEGIQFTSIYDQAFPRQLHLINQRPPFITYKGTLLEQDRAGIAVVGTRNASERGLRQAFEIGSALASCGITVVSGLAAGIDTSAHRGAMSVGGRTVAVIGTGLHNYFPAENRDLQLDIAKKGAVISQFLPDIEPTKSSFPMRNAIMSGYSGATLVVEASSTSGAKMQARLALGHGRPVILLDTLVEQHEWAKDYSSRPNVTVVGSAREACEVAIKTTSRYEAKVLTEVGV